MANHVQVDVSLLLKENAPFKLPTKHCLDEVSFLFLAG